MLPCGNDFLTCGNELSTHGNELLTCGTELLTHGHNFLSCGNEIKNAKKTVLCPFLGSAGIQIIFEENQVTGGLHFLNRTPIGSMVFQL